MSTTASKSFGTQKARLPHLVRGTGGVAGEVSDLRGDIEEGFQALENRTGFPELDLHDITGGAIAAAGGDAALVGRVLLQGQSFDELNIVVTTADLLIAALKPGDSGITVVVETGAGALSVLYVPATKVLTITLPVAATDTVANIATAINVAASCVGVLRANEDVAGNITQAGAGAAALALTGGVGDYDNNKVMVGGREALPQNEVGATTTAKWTDTGILVTTPAVGGAGDHAQVTVESNGVRAQSLSVVLT